jgi:hypothetical protein
MARILESIFKCAGIHVENTLKSDDRNGLYSVKQKLLGRTYEANCLHIWIEEKEL